MSRDNVVPFPPPAQRMASLPLELDGDVYLAELAGALAGVGLCLSNNPRTGRIRIQRIPPFLRPDHEEPKNHG